MLKKRKKNPRKLQDLRKEKKDETNMRLIVKDINRDYMFQHLCVANFDLFGKSRSVIYLLIIRLSSRERNARDSIQRLQQETKGIVVNKHNST